MKIIYHPENGLRLANLISDKDTRPIKTAKTLKWNSSTDEVGPEWEK